MCAAAELERRYERIFGYLHDDLSRKLPSLGLALSVLLPSGTDRLHTGRGPWRWFPPRDPLVLRSFELRQEGLMEKLDTWRGLITSPSSPPNAALEWQAESLNRQV